MYDSGSKEMATCLPNFNGTRNDDKKLYLRHPLALLRQSLSFKIEKTLVYDMKITFNLNTISLFWFGIGPILSNQTYDRS